MSNRIDRHDKIQQITAKLIELNSNFANANGLSQVDIDLLKKYIVDLYDEVLSLTPKEDKKAVDEKVEATPVTPPPVVEKPIEQPEPVEVKAPEVTVEKEEEPIVEEPVAEPQAAEIKTEKETTSPPPAQEEQKQEPTPEPVAEKEEDIKENTLNDNLKQPETDDLAAKLGKTPIHDLKKAISINKKFEFISQLFDGDHESYTKSVHYLNGLNSKDEAMTFFNSLKKENNWDEENKRYIEFADLVGRRFM